MAYRKYIDYLPIPNLENDTGSCPNCGHSLTPIHGERYAGTGEYGDVYIQPVKCGVIGRKIRDKRIAEPVHCENACQSEFEIYDTRVGEYTV